MTPVQKIKHAIILRGIELYEIDNFDVSGITSEDIDELYDEFYEYHEDALSDAKNEIRGGEVETGLPSKYSRHYESKSVASKMPDGSWVGWTYWYGGGKHGCPEEIDWMNNSYALDVIEEEKVMIVRTFTKMDDNSAS